MAGGNEQEGLELLLTELQVNSKGELLVRFRDKGEIYFPDWRHLFPTGILGRLEDEDEEKQQELIDLEKRIRTQIASDPILKKYQTRLKNKYWWVYQIFMPILHKERLSKMFIRGNYTKQARWRLCNPGNYVRVSSNVLTALDKKSEIENILDEVEKAVVLERKTQAQVTRTLNELENIFEDYDGNNFSELRERARTKSSLKSVPENIFELRKTASDRIREVNQSLGETLRLTYTAHKKSSKGRELRVEQTDFSYLEKEKPECGPDYRNPRIRMARASELFAMKWVFLDIEIPKFKRVNPVISWVGVNFVEGDKEVKEIHTTRDPKAEELAGYKIYRYANEKQLVEGLKNRVLKENPSFVSAYNHKFDIFKLRETEEGFGVGKDLSNPFFRVTTKFFEKLGIKDRFVVDPFDWAKAARRFGINVKLESVAGFEKEIGYGEMEILDEEDPKKVGTYLAEDVDRLTGIWKSKDFRDNLEDVLWICDKYGLGFERVMHSIKAVNDHQEKGFFKELRVYRENVPPHLRTIKMQELEREARTFFTKKVVEKAIRTGDGENTKGLFHDVYKVYVPVGSFFKSLMERRFPKIKDFFDYKESFKDDKRRLFFLERMTEAFASWIMTDYGFYLKAVEDLETAINERKIDPIEFGDVYKAFRARLKESSKFQLDKLDEAQLSTRAVEQLKDEKLEEFLRKYGLVHRGKVNYEAFRDLANARSKIKRVGRVILGNYAVFPSRDFFDPTKHRKPEEIDIIDETLNKRFKEISDFLRENKFSIIRQEGNYLYIKGNGELLRDRNAPLVLVDEIERAYNSDSIYYEKYGFVNHLKNEEDPNSNLSLFQMTVFSSMIKNLLNGSEQKAGLVLQEALIRLKERRVEAKSLIFQNKSKGVYFAYADNSERKDGKILFVQERRFATGEIERDERGEYFLLEKDNKKRGGQKESVEGQVEGRAGEGNNDDGRENVRRENVGGERGKVAKVKKGLSEGLGEKVYILQPEDIRFNMAIYERKFVDRARGILSSLGVYNVESREVQQELGL